MTFQDTIRTAIDFGLLRTLALEYEVAESTVWRWARGITAPLPRMQRVIEAFVASKIRYKGRMGRIRKTFVHCDSHGAVHARNKDGSVWCTCHNHKVLWAFTLQGAVAEARKRGLWLYHDWRKMQDVGEFG